MNERITKWLDNIKDYLATLSSAKKVALAGVGAVMVVAMLAVVMVAGKNPYQQLYSDLASQDSAAIAKNLGELKIPYQISEDRKTISVPKDMIHTARMELAKDGLPGEDVIGLEAFDNFSFGTSSYVQRIQYVRAVQGELTRSIQRLDAVKRARVHISIPPKKTFLDDQDPPKASVVLELHPGKELSKAEVKGVAHIVSSAVEGLSSQAITIVNSKGKMLHRPNEGDDTEISFGLLEMQRSIESKYEDRIEELLGPLVGVGKVIAKVTAELDLSRTNTTEESYDGDKAVPQTVTKNDEVSTGSRPNPIGIPGSRSNLPGSEVEEPQMPMATTNTENSTATTQYAIPRKVQTIAKPSGEIKRLTVAVVVDGKYGKDAANPGEMVYVPRTEDELQQFRQLVSNAVGYDANRRDDVTVTSMPFETNSLLLEEELPVGINWQEFLREALKNGLIGLVVVFFFMLVLRPFLKWATQSDLEKGISVLPKTVEELEEARRDEGVKVLSKAMTLLESSESLGKKEEEELTKRIVEELDRAPQKGRSILQDWLKDNALPEAV